MSDQTGMCILIYFMLSKEFSFLKTISFHNFDRFFVVKTILTILHVKNNMTTRYLMIKISQHPQWISNKIEKTFNGIFAG